MVTVDDSTDNLEASARDVGIVARGTGLGLVGAAAAKGLQAVTFFLLARLAPREQVGMITLCVGAVAILSFVGKGGFNWVVSRYVAVHQAAGEKERVKGDIYGSLLWTTVFSVVLAGAVTGLAPWLSRHVFTAFGPAVAAPLVAFVWWVPPTAVVIVLVSAVLAVGSARPRVVVRDFVVPAVFLAVGPAAWVVWHSAAAVGVAYTFSAVVGLGLGWHYFRRVFPGLGAVRGVCDHKVLLGMSFTLTLTDLAAVGLSRADQMVLGHLIPADTFAIYAMATSLAVLATMALTALTQIQAPVIARLYEQGKTAELDALLKTFTRLCLTASAPFTAFLIGLAGPMMGLLGHDYVAGAPVLIIASLGVLVNVATASVGISLMMTGHQGLAFATNLGAVALLVGMVWWLTPLYGIVGAAVGLALAVSLANLVRLGLEVRLLHVNPWTPAMLKSLLAGAVSGGAAWGLARALGVTGAEKLAWLLPVVAGLAVLSCGIYAGMIVLLGVEKSDREAARAIWERVGRRSDK
jgi:O-antigen/teichoic acid export membrane protein